MKDKIFSIFFPVSYARTYIQSGLVLGIIFIIFFSSFYSIKSDLDNNFIKGQIVDVKVGSKGGGVGKYSGRSTFYYIQLKNYKRIFFLEDASIFENWQFDESDFKAGDSAEFKIRKTDLNILNIPTIYSPIGPQRIMWPEEASTVKIYGLTINNKKILSVGSSVRGLAYNTYFWLIVPLFIYIIICLYVKTGFKYWTQRAEDNSDGWK